MAMLENNTPEAPAAPVAPVEPIAPAAGGRYTFDPATGLHTPVDDAPNTV